MGSLVLIKLICCQTLIQVQPISNNMLVFYAMPCDASEQLRAVILGQKGNAATAAKRAKLLANNRAAIVPRKQEVRVGKLHTHTHTHRLRDRDQFTYWQSRN